MTHRCSVSARPEVYIQVDVSRSRAIVACVDRSLHCICKCTLKLSDDILVLRLLALKLLTIKISKCIPSFRSTSASRNLCMPFRFRKLLQVPSFILLSSSYEEKPDRIELERSIVFVSQPHFEFIDINCEIRHNIIFFSSFKNFGLETRQLTADSIHLAPCKHVEHTGLVDAIQLRLMNPAPKQYSWLQMPETVVPCLLRFYGDGWANIGLRGRRRAM